MGKYSELYLEIRNIAKTTEKMEKIIQNTSIKMINGNELIEFCRSNVYHIYSVFGSKDEFWHTYLILKFLEGKNCPICNTEKSGLIKKKCPKHSSLSLDKISSRLNFNIQKLKEWNANLYRLNFIWLESLSTKNVIFQLNRILNENIQLKILQDIIDFMVNNPDEKISIGTITVLNEDNDYCSFEEGRDAFNELLERKILLSNIDNDVGIRVLINEAKIDDIYDFIKKSTNENSPLLNKFDSLIEFHKIDDDNDDEEEINPDAFHVNCETLISDLSKYKHKNPNAEHLIISSDGMDLFFDISNPQDLVDLGFVLYYSLSKYEDSIEVLKGALELKPDYFEAWNLMGTIYGMKSHYKDALRCFKNSLVINENFADAWYNLSITAEVMNQINESIEYITKATNLDPFNKMYQKRAEKLQSLKN